ncbi:MAG: LysM peptidoglycan-binding domain-containing protein [Flavobacteriales bacterium Tduv]
MNYRYLKEGETVLIPTQESVLSKNQSLIYQVQTGETLYTISKKYGIDIQTFIKQNPHVSKGLKQGDFLFINVKNTEQSLVSHRDTASTSEKKMTTYQVKAKETLYSISKRFGLYQEELKKINPKLKNGLKKGMILRVPAKKDSVQEKNILDKSLKPLPKNSAYDFIIYTVKDGNTIFSIMRAYDIGLEDLMDYNPGLKKGLKVGMDLKIPSRKRRRAKVSPTLDGINVVLMLPLLAQKPHIDELSKHAIAFYLGAKAAIASVAQKRKVYVKVFDTENDKKKIENFLNTYDFSLIHAIIGPFFRSSVEQVAQALKNEKTPVVAPLSASETLDIYPNVVQAKVKDQYLVDPIVEEIKRGPSSVKTVYLIGSKQAEAVTQRFKSLLLEVRSQMQIITDDLSTIPSDAPPFFAVLLGEDPKLGQSFVQTVQDFKPGQIIPLGVGYNEAYYNNVALLKKYGLVFTVRYHSNKDEAAQRRFEKLRKETDENPDKYKLLGFDLTLDVLERLLKNKKLLPNLEDKESSGIISKYRYEKLSDGGYINKGIWLTSMKSSEAASAVLKN